MNKGDGLTLHAHLYLSNFQTLPGSGIARGGSLLNLNLKGKY